MNATTVICPHCGDENPPDGQFCGACGKALPTPMSAGPRIVEGSGFASTTAGQKLQTDELHKQARKASGALLTVAIIQTTIAGVLIFIANNNNRVDVMLENGIFLGIAGCAVVFWVLYVWSRRQPLPAAIVGLVLYATLVTLNVITSMKQLSQGGAGGGGFGGIGIGWLDIVIIVILAKAIAAGSKYRKMSQTTV